MPIRTTQMVWAAISDGYEEIGVHVNFDPKATKWRRIYTKLDKWQGVFDSICDRDGTMLTLMDGVGSPACRSWWVDNIFQCITLQVYTRRYRCHKCCKEFYSDAVVPGGI